MSSVELHYFLTGSSHTVLHCTVLGSFFHDEQDSSMQVTRLVDDRTCRTNVTNNVAKWAMTPTEQGVSLAAGVQLNKKHAAAPNCHRYDYTECALITQGVSSRSHSLTNTYFY